MTFISDIRRGPARLGWATIPALMRAGVLFSTFAAAILFLITPLAVLNIGSYSINERPVTGLYFISHAYPVLMPYVGLALAISFGIWTEKSWVRPLSLALWLAVDLILVYDIAIGSVVGANTIAYSVWAVVYLGIVWWYFYRKRTVVSYYRSLESETLPQSAGA